MAHPKLPGALKRLATGRNSARRTHRPVQNSAEHYTKRAQNAINQARSEAQTNNSGEIGVAHLLLAITGDPTDLTARFLTHYKVTPAFLQTTLQPSPLLPESPGINPDQHFQRVIELAATVALNLNHPYIGTEHFLLGIFEEGTEFERLCQPLNLSIPELYQQFNELLQKPEYQPFAYQ